MAYEITKNDYFQLQQPAKSEDLNNIIEVASNPLNIHDFNDELYKTSEAIPISDNETIYAEIKYRDIPNLNPIATAYWVAETTTVPAEAEELEYNDTTGEISNPILDSYTEYYSWGANVRVTNDYGEDGYCIIVVSGYPLKPEPEIMVARDADSIAENGILKYEYPENHLIQSRDIAQDIADDLLDSYSTPRKDVNLQWRGNPALELRDEIQVPEYQKYSINTQGIFTIYKQVIEFDGTLKSTVDARKVSTTTSTTTLAP